MRRWLPILLVMACSGQIDEPSHVDPDNRIPPGVDPLTDPAGLGETGVRRLTRSEYRQTVRDLTGIDIAADVELLPLDDRTPFDNDYTTQMPSRTLVEAAKALADRVAERVFADADVRDTLLGCTPSGPSDEACLRTFIESFGRRALRRPLEPSEVDEYAAFIAFAEEGDDFDVAASMVLRALLQDVEMLYRIEIGDPVSGRAGIHRLNDFELATRLSYFLWGSTPDPALLDAAAAGDLSSEDGLRSEVQRLLEDPRATDRLQDFHAMWLGYDDIPLSDELAQRLRRESDRLVERIVMEEERSWLDLFTFDQTWVDDALAEHYGLEAPAGGEGWVPYGDSGRAGLLSHGAFLSAGAKFGDTSPVLRGIAVRERLLCQTIPPPDPSLAVNTDEPPGEDPDACKEERYAMHSTGACAGCHQLMDPIGFGLEQYGPAGELRLTEVDKPECTIRGEGEVVGVGEFSGAAELGSLLAGSGELDLCAVQQMHRFVVGRGPAPGDARTMQSLMERFRDGYRLSALVEDVATSEAFRFRVEGE